MRETGRVIELKEGTAKVRINRSTACGDCGACQVGREKLEMILTVENHIGAKVGNDVEVDIENTNFLTAVLIGYGIPLLGLLFGVLLGYYGAPLLGFGYNTSQGIAGITGLICMGAGYYLIKLNEHQIKKLKKFHPVIVRIVNEVENHGESVKP